MKEIDGRRGRDGGDPGTPGIWDDTGPLDYDFVEPLAKRAIEATMHLDGMTYNPKSDKFYDIRRNPDALALFGELARGGGNMDSNLPIYLVGITCHTNIEMDLVVKNAYNYASQRVSQPLIGVWTNPGGKRYLDVVIPVQFPEDIKSDEWALEVGRKYGQDCIIRLDPDGSYDALETNS